MTKNVDGIPKRLMLADIRGLHRMTTTDAYPIPLPLDIVSAVAGHRFISTVDATSFLYQWPVKRKDRHKLSAVTNRGQEHLNVAVTDFKNCPSHVQRQMDRLLR